MNKLRFNTLTDALLILLFLGFVFLLLRPFSPKEVEGDFFGVKFIGKSGLRYQLFGDEFSCAPIEDLPLDRMCQAEFEGQSLSVRIRFQDESRHFLTFCAVTYGETAVDCRPSFGYENDLPYVVVENDLAISAERYAELRAERPLLNWPESIWMEMLLGAAIVLGIAMMVWRWLRFDEPVRRHPVMAVLSTLVIAFLAYLVTSLMTNFLVSFLFDGPNAPYWLSFITAVIGAVGVVVWRWRLWQGWQPRFGRLADSLAGGTTALMLTYFFGLLVLLSLGFVD